MSHVNALNRMDSVVRIPHTESQIREEASLGVERREHLSPEEFLAEYVAKHRPVVVPGALNGCRAVSRWTLDHLRTAAGHRIVRLKAGLTESGVGGLKTVSATLGDYIDSLEAYESGRRPEGTAHAVQRPPYLHDVPLAGLLPDAVDDLDGFPAGYFPRWYRRDWWKFAQFFLGPSRSLTPLHFDCLLTHNLFFQVMGRKRFTLLPYDQLPYCYRYRWRWCEVDAENPDYARHPLYRHARPLECIVAPGDLLYMPPGMLHHVRSLDCAISFNVDWHTPDSALRGVLALARGMPLKNVYYNAVIACGLCTGIPARRLLPWYRSYLNYVS
jgi:hypothetical protein